MNARDVIIKASLKYYPDLQAIYIFGTYGTPDEQKESDVDIALLFPHDRAKLIKNLAVSECRYALEDILKRDVDIINLRTVNTVFQHEIIQEGRIIYQQDENAVDCFEMYVISSYQKLNEERAGIIQEIFESGRILNT
ncbi:MAG: nucleotidyltransferase domain-containing protein [Thermodesulfobacteriota bacterium]